MNDRTPPLSGRLPDSPRRLGELEIKILFPEIFRACHRQLLATVYRITGDFHAAQEIVQDAFVKLNHHLHTRKVDHRIVAWLHSVARNDALKFLRRRKRQPDSVPLEESAGTLPELRHDDREDAVRMAKFLARLPEHKRLVVELRARDGLSFAEIANRTGRNTDAVRKLFSRTCRELQIMMQPGKIAQPVPSAEDDDDDPDLEGIPALAT